MSNNKLTKAMILAAGFGKRLMPLTLNTPKALVEINGKPMIELLIQRLINFGITDITVNTHHFSEQVRNYFKNKDFGIKINLAHESTILGTGGGIKNADSFLNDTDFFLVHNVDVISEIDISKMYSYHIKNNSFITLAVNERITSRPLLFDENNLLSGRIINGEIFRKKESLNTEFKRAFCGIHIISSEIFRFFPEVSNFDIIPLYLDLSINKKIISYNTEGTFWKDLGKIKDFS